MRKIVGALLAGVAAFSSVGCSTPSPPAPLTGMTVYQVETSLPDATFVIYDLSTPVLDLEPTFTSLQGSAFTVITACGATTDIGGDVVPLGVVATSELTDDMRTKALSGGFDGLLSECAS